MPITYRPSEADINEVDTDDSIVLSDLVRSGEASRLRRRGAMRLEHHTQDGAATWEPDETPRAQQHREKEEYLWTLFCGGEQEDDDELDEYHCHEAFEPSLFPLCPVSVSAPSRKRARRTNGCGALIHMRAAPRARLGVWTAKTRASDAVVSLDAAYFDHTAVSKIVRSACGCVREGVGCAVCGNPLGTRYRPCKTAEDGIFVAVPHATTRHHHHHPRPHLHPDGQAYWHESTPPPSPNFYIYTFFSSAVSSAPAYTFSARPLHMRQHHPPPPQVAVYSQPPPLVDLDDSLMFARTLTSSPAPLSDVGEEDDREGDYAMASNWAEFANAGGPLDPDGDDTAPNSPDKSNEVMLFPER